MHLKRNVAAKISKFEKIIYNIVAAWSLHHGHKSSKWHVLMCGQWLLEKAFRPPLTYRKMPTQKQNVQMAREEERCCRSDNSQRRTQPVLTYLRWPRVCWIVKKFAHFLRECQIY